MKLKPYCIPLLPCPLPMRERKGILIETEQGLGEMAPLPGFSTETLEEAIQSLSTTPLPSAAFALRCAEQPLPKSFPPIPICALETWREGFSTLKLKIGHLTPAQALTLIRPFQQQKIRLRLDINRKWTLAMAIECFAPLDPDGIEYFEEPLAHPDELFELAHRFPEHPLALDETLTTPHAENFLSCVKAFVLKPTLLGSRLDHLISLGKEKKKDLVFSSSYESNVGLLHIAHLQAQHAPHIAAGLDTARFFTTNFFPMRIENGTLNPENIEEYSL